jgi:hypothetical protein
MEQAMFIINQQQQIINNLTKKLETLDKLMAKLSMYEQNMPKDDTKQASVVAPVAPILTDNFFLATGAPNLNTQIVVDEFMEIDSTVERKRKPTENEFSDDENNQPFTKTPTLMATSQRKKILIAKKGMDPPLEGSPKC